MTDPRNDARTKRLKAALRDNLRRRKAQDRGRQERTGATQPDAAEPETEPLAETPGPHSDETGL